MKTFLFALALVGLSAGVAGAAGYSACLHNNSKACTDARNAFADHHGGVFPEQWYNQWYQGRQGRWSQRGNEWRWEGLDGDRYWKGKNGWAWTHHDHHGQDHDHDHDHH